MDVDVLVNNQYKIIEHIGRGGMADVWSARDTRLRRMVAIKTIVSGLSKDLDPLELFKREAHTIAQMEHPHILPIYDFGEFDNSLYIVMRYVTGGSLEDMLRDGPMPPEGVLRMGEAIGQALDYAHSNNVIHLDLKPPNILLDSSGAPYLADFGLATVLDPEGRARNPGSGTLLYMAPEQMLSDTIDHRADIYSFCIMLFHMLTGSLPFDGSIPLSMSQLQRDMGLPSVSDHLSFLPHDLTEVLRLGTHEDPKLRPDTHMEIMEQFRDILQPSGIGITTASYGDYQIEADPYNLLTETYAGDLEDADLLEAIDIYTRARYDWQGGQGRFLLGVTNFILMSDYYQNALQYNLKIDTAGYQVLLRGAIEYNYEVDYWWQQLKDDDRRWVCLHALRSGNTPARIRALYRLETLPDEAGNAVIPRLVAQALEVESDNNAKIAALTVLGTRSRLLKDQARMNIMTEYRGRLISSMTRLGIQVNPPAAWQEAIYSDDVDRLVAEQAFDPDPDVAEFAARTVGKMRSLAAVTHISREQKNQRNGALQALALVRDEAPSLPDVVNREARFYAWITNTFRRLTENPIELIASVLIVFIMGWIAMGNHIWSWWEITVGSLGIQRWTNTVALGVIFGLMMSLTYLLTVIISRRLAGFWAWWMRLLVAGVLGFSMAMLSFASYRYFFLQEAPFDILWDQMRFAGASLAFGLLATNLLRLRGWQGVILTSIVTFTPIYAAHRAYYYAQDSTIAPLAVLGVLLGIFCGWRAASLSKVKPVISSSVPGIVAGVGLGLAWTAGAWGLHFMLIEQLNAGISFNWDTVLLLTGAHLLFGIGGGYWLNRAGRISMSVSALVGFAAVYAVVAWQFFDYSFSVPLQNPSFEILYATGTPLLPDTAQPIILYDVDQLGQIFTLTLPFVVVIALGMNMTQLLSGWWTWIGTPRTSKERGAWLNGTLSYVMVLTAIISILSLYSSGVNRLWELGWSAWAFVTFVLALAAFRWAKWGADSLVISGLFLLLGAIAFDGVAMYQQAIAGDYPALLKPVTQFNNTLQNIGLTSATIYEYHFWGMWAILLALFVWGAQRQYLWGGIGLITLMVGWLIVVFSVPLQGSVALFAATNVALVIYVLRSKYELMEIARLRLPWNSSGSVSVSDISGTPDTLVNLSEIELPSAPATAVLPDIDEQDILRDPRKLATIDFTPGETDTMLAQAPNESDLYTQLEPVQKKPTNNNTDLKINLDTSGLRQAKERDEDTTDSADAEISDSKTRDFRGMSINLDTSGLRQVNKSDDSTEADTDDTQTRDFRNIKINLDTSGLRQVNKSDTAEDTPEPRTELDPKARFKFDGSNIVNPDTEPSGSEEEEKDDS
ncbi:MAG: protein kinase domain-containing protein [Anaerolineae bacterium]